MKSILNKLKSLFRRPDRTYKKMFTAHIVYPNGTSNLVKVHHAQIRKELDLTDMSLSDVGPYDVSFYSFDELLHDTSEFKELKQYTLPPISHG